MYCRTTATQVVSPARIAACSPSIVASSRQNGRRSGCWVMYLPTKNQRFIAEGAEDSQRTRRRPNGAKRQSSRPPPHGYRFDRRWRAVPLLLRDLCVSIASSAIKRFLLPVAPASGKPRNAPPLPAPPRHLGPQPGAPAARRDRRGGVSRRVSLVQPAREGSAGGRAARLIARAGPARASLRRDRHRA